MFSLKCAAKENIISPVSMRSSIQETNIIATYPNLNIILRISLTHPIFIASGERSFSVIALQNHHKNVGNSLMLIFYSSRYGCCWVNDCKPEVTTEDAAIKILKIQISRQEKLKYFFRIALGR